MLACALTQGDSGSRFVDGDCQRLTLQSIVPSPAAVAQVNEVIGNYNLVKKLHALVSDLLFHSDAKRCTMLYGEILAVHAIGQNGLWMKGIY